MTNIVDVKVHEGEPWKLLFTAHEEDGVTIMPLPSGSEVEFILSDEDGTILTKTVGDGVTITNELGGQAQIIITDAEQLDYHLGFATAYFYAIRVTKGDLVSMQAEGRFEISDSLFKPPPDPLVMQFRLRFTEFTEDDTLVALYIADATRVVDADGFWSTEDRSLAILYLAAHYLQLRLNAYTTHTSAGLETGAVRMIRVEDRTVSYGDPNALTASNKGGFSATVYGQLYLAMRRKYPIWHMRA